MTFGKRHTQQAQLSAVTALSSATITLKINEPLGLVKRTSTPPETLSALTTAPSTGQGVRERLVTESCNDSAASRTARRRLVLLPRGSHVPTPSGNASRITRPPCSRGCFTRSVVERRPPHT